MSSRTLFNVLEEAAARHGTKPAMHQPQQSKTAGKYRTYSWIEYRDAAREVACGLRALGVSKGDFVALHSETRAEFYIADLGTMGAGCIAAALYTSLPSADHIRTMETILPQALFVENPKAYANLKAAGLPEGRFPCILLTGEAEGALTFDALRQRGRETLESFDRIRNEYTPADYAILYMTSGATGEPKMGLVTHASVVSNLDMGPAVLPIGPEDSSLVFLPSAHIAQRVVMELLPIRCGMPVYFSEGITRMANELREVKPTFLLAPPRVWERVYSSIYTEIKKRPAIARKLFYISLGLGTRAAHMRREGQSVPAWMQRALKVADKLVFSKIRERLGGRIQYAISGAAPLGRELAHFYEAVGLPLIEGYGLTEGGVVTLNPLINPRPGSIGRALERVELKLTDDGELCIKAPCLFSGYYNDPEATASVLRGDWLHTGDIAEIDADGFVAITGRKKELIVSSNGKKIYPARIESLFKIEPLINQVMLIGDRQPYVTALLTLNTANAETLGPDLKGQSMAELAAAPSVLKEVAAAVKRVNQSLPSFEQIKRFRVLDRDFTIEAGELTPTMKVRRKQVLDNFKETIGELYLGREEMA